MDSKTATDPTNEDILSALDQTGFLLEQRVYRLFEEHSSFDDVRISVPYTDPDTGKSREIDVVADYGAFVGDRNMACPWVSADIIVECKNTDNPFIVVGRDVAPEAALYRFDNVYVPVFDPLRLGWNRGPYSAAFLLNSGSLLGRAFEGGFEGNQLVRLNRQSGKWRADNNSVYDSIVMPLIKATVSLMEKPSYEPEDEHPTYHLYFPILVTNGPVYTVSIGQESPSVRRVPWAPVVRHLSDGTKTKKYLIEVVEFSQLENYINERALRFVHSVEQTLASKARMFNPFWLRKQYGDPSRIAEFETWLDLFSKRTGIRE